MVVSSESLVKEKEEDGEPWQSKVTSLSSGICQLYENKEFWDVEFSVKNKKFKCHRLILGAGSQKFADMLLKPDACREITDDLSSEVGFECLIRYIYTGKLGAMKENEVLEAYRVAKRYKQEGLIKKCEELIQDMEITVDNVCSVYNQGSDVELLKDRCLQFIKQNSIEVLASVDFLRATPSTVQEMFEFNCLENAPISVLQKHVLRWGSDQFPKMIDYTVVRDLLKDIRILGKLKIEKLSTDELISLVEDFPELLTPKEFQQFNIHAHKPDRPLPDWCEL